MTTRIIFFIFFIFCSQFIFSEQQEIYFVDSAGAIIGKDSIEINASLENSNRHPELAEGPILKFLNGKKIKNKRIVAALLAFPFPFGIVGLHRIYLGTKPYVPVAYIGSLGGVFGIIPLIDFFVILFDKDFEHFENNGKVLMWIR